MTQYELQHHGILGQRWGIRRYQNKDGSLTEAGRKRYDSQSNNDSNVDDVSLKNNEILNDNPYAAVLDYSKIDKSKNDNSIIDPSKKKKY